MDIFYLTCPGCSREYYADVSLLSIDAELHCPFCGLYFRREEAKKIITGDRKLSSIVQLNGDIVFYKPEK
jgi:DNA-directed RNA polymerase subunit RPC12/RpoP